MANEVDDARDAVEALPFTPTVPLSPRVQRHETASVDVHRREVAEPVVTAGGSAVRTTVGARQALTVTLPVAVPPGPVQSIAKERVDATDSVAEPLGVVSDDHPPTAVQRDVSVDVHVRVTVPLTATSEALAVSATVGGFATTTVSDARVVPPKPEHSMANSRVAETRTESEPLLPRAVDHPPTAVQESAFIESQLSTTLSPLATVRGEAAKRTVGGSQTRTVCATIFRPVAPRHSSSYVLVVVGRTTSEPFADRGPLHAPRASHSVAPSEVHVRVTGSGARAARFALSAERETDTGTSFEGHGADAQPPSVVVLSLGRAPCEHPESAPRMAHEANACARSRSSRRIARAPWRTERSPWVDSGDVPVRGSADGRIT
jgi:hypothetical protein